MALQWYLIVWSQEERPSNFPLTAENYVPDFRVPLIDINHAAFLKERIVNLVEKGTLAGFSFDIQREEETIVRTVHDWLIDTYRNDILNTDGNQVTKSISKLDS